MTNTNGAIAPGNENLWRIIWIATLALGVFMTFFRIGADSYWYDESYSVAAARHPLSEMIPIIAGDSHPPLYYMALRAVTLIAGDSTTAVRSLSALGILALASLGFFGVRKVWGNRGGLVFALLALLTPMSIAAGREARMYTWLAFFVTATVLQGSFALSRGRKRDWALLAFLTLGAAYTHYYGLMAVTIYWLILLVAAAMCARGANGKKLLTSALVTAGVTVTAYLPWVMALLRQAARVHENYWIPKPDLSAVIRALGYPFMQRFAWGFNPYATAVFVSVLALGLFAVVRSVAKKKPDAFLLATALAVYALTFVAAYGVSIAFKPIFYERYFTGVMGLLILCFAAFAAGFKRPALSAVVVVAYALVAFPTLARVYTEEINGPLDLVAADLKPLVKPGDVFVHGSEHTFGLLRYAFPNNEHYLYMPKGFVPFGNHAVFAPNASTGNDITVYNERPVTIWLIGRPGEYYKTPFEDVYGAPHRSVVGKMRKYSKAPGWLTMQVYQVAWDPNKVAAATAPVEKVSLAVTLTGVEPARGGKIFYAIYNQEELGPNTFLAAGSVDPTSATVSFSIPDLEPGTYALMVFHDQNGNSAPDFSKNGPTEGLALGHDPLTLPKQFTFDDIKFDVSRDTSKRSVKMYYPK
jgi:uncharacterized protein (DUF2141 family)